MELLKHIAVGLIVIIYGVWQVVDTYKDYLNLRKSKALEYVYWKGYIIGVACIIAGILEFFNWWGW